MKLRSRIVRVGIHSNIRVVNMKELKTRLFEKLQLKKQQRIESVYWGNEMVNDNILSSWNQESEKNDYSIVDVNVSTLY